jgi:hypothetical protein
MWTAGSLSTGTVDDPITQLIPTEWGGRRPRLSATNLDDDRHAESFPYFSANQLTVTPNPWSTVDLVLPEPNEALIVRYLTSALRGVPIIVAVPL